MIWSACRAARRWSSGVRTVQVNNGRPSTLREKPGTGEGRSDTR